MNGRRLLVASVISVQNSPFIYPSCQNCFSKLLLDFERYSCLKCGCSGDSKEANYRYRLSLEVADTQSVFEVTVFGSCLDVYFGVTAKGLQRYIEKLCQEVGESDKDATPDVLFHAVESCFIGKKFVFGVKDYYKPESTTSLQNDCQTNRYPRAIIACQMFIPNSGLIGNTVIHYLEQRQSSHFKQGHGNIKPPDLFMAFDQSSSELSSLPGSSDLGTAPSCSADGLSVLWPQSFRLTSSPVSSGTAEDPIDLILSRKAYSRQKWEDNPVSLSSHLVYNSQEHSLTATKRNVQEDKKSHLYSSQKNCIAIKSQPESDSSLGREGGKLLQNPLESEEKNMCNEISMQHNYCLKKSCTHLLHQSYDTSLCFPASSSIHLPSREDANSEEAPWVWDELPSSESLNEFIAKFESDKALVLPTKVNGQVHFPSHGADEFHGHFNQLSPKPGIFHVNLKTGQPGEKLQVLVEKVERHKENVLPCHQVNFLSSCSSQESHQDAFYSSLSSNGKKKLVCLSHQQPLLLPSSSLMEVKPPHSEESCLKSEEGVDQDISSSKNCHSISCLKCSSKCLENSCLQARYTTACLNSKDDGMKKEKGNIFVNLNQSTEITKIQGDISTSGTCKKSSGVGEPKEDLLFQVDGCSFKVDDGSFLQKCSDSHELSFNASADLFDSTRETEATVGKLNSAQEDPLTKQCITSEFTPRELNGSWNKSSSSSMLTISDSKRNSPVTGLISGSEHTPSGSLDFIPNSQSTPLARPCLQVRLPRGKESILSELPLNKLSWVGAKCKRLRPALGNPSVKRLVSKFLQCRRTSEASDCQQIWANDSPAQRMSENVDEEWIPPSEKKQVQPLGIQNGKVLKRRRNLVRNSADCPAVEKATLSKNKVRCEIPRSPTRLMRVELSPKNPTVLRFERHPMYKDDASCRQIVNGSPGFSAFSNVKSNLSSTPCPMANVTHPMANVTSWSLELFTDNSQLLSMDALFPTPSA
ncbi:DNA damage-induced apoptosis suppressor protein isoform X1 [Sceloporus undulatus]|uniref:DNA damage-induced apoptosis suppressor protein isoform X1 n=1 Tax=Sceloporus undulatus TaxID=8520 RepID=UPI001C4BB356|nr:DNA damage-induced apoptosis suppressor protein isoform X1 [Sceloporus undulatus]